MGLAVLVRRYAVACMSVFVAAVIIAGCTSVQSVDVSTADVKERSGAYINYSVANSLFTIQISAAPISSQAPATAASLAPAPAAAAAAAGPTTWTINGTLVSGTGTPATPSGNQGQAATDSTQCGVLSAEYSAAQTYVAAQISTYKLLTVRLAQMAAGKPAKADTPKKLSSDVQAYFKIVGDPNYKALVSNNAGKAISGVDGVYDKLVSDCPPKVTISIQQSIVPDNSRAFALKPSSNVFYTDALNLSTDSNGFLTNGAPTTTSELPGIVAAIASDIGLATPAGSAAAAARVAGRFSLQEEKKKKCPTGIVPDLTHEIAALACSNNAQARDMARQILANLPQPGSLANLPGAALPVTVSGTVKSFEDPDADDPFPEQLQQIAEKFGVTLKLKCSGRAGVPAAPENVPTREFGMFAPTSGVYDGLVVSASRACRFRAIQTRDNGIVTLAQTYLWAQDSRYLTILPTSRGLLVARSVSYTFSGGLATGVTDSRPSELAALVSLPGTVIGSFFSGVTTAFSNHETYTVGKTTDLTDETNYLTAQSNYLAAQQALQKAKASSAPASP